MRVANEEKGGQVQLSLHEKDNSTASIKLINYFIKKNKKKALTIMTEKQLKSLSQERQCSVGTAQKKDYGALL